MMCKVRAKLRDNAKDDKNNWYPTRPLCCATKQKKCPKRSIHTGEMKTTIMYLVLRFAQVYNEDDGLKVETQNMETAKGFVHGPKGKHQHFVQTRVLQRDLHKRRKETLEA